MTTRCCRYRGENTRTDPNSKHWFTTSFFWRKVPESDARSVVRTDTTPRAIEDHKLLKQTGFTQSKTDNEEEDRKISNGKGSLGLLQSSGNSHISTKEKQVVAMDVSGTNSAPSFTR